MRNKNLLSKTHLDPGNLLLFLYVACMIVLVSFAMVVDTSAAGLPEEVRQGELLFKNVGENGESMVAAPHLSQKVEIAVTGMTARTTLRQRFVNNAEDWQEGIYVFPLPDESAVDQLRMIIGERVIVGEIKEREEAKKVYTQAKAAGKKASLLAQERPNIFTIAVANIGPGEEVEIEIGYSQMVALADDIFSLRFPMVVEPRYIPGNPLKGSDSGEKVVFSGDGWAMDTDQVPDASRITPPVDGGQMTPENSIQLMVELAAGFPVARLSSLYHGIRVEKEDESVKHICFTGEVKADRDFVLEWEAEKFASPKAALFSEQKDGDMYQLLMLTPPTLGDDSTSPARELIFILDTSGSMAGPSIIQAKEALILAISRLSEQDRFNVIEFNSHTSKLFSDAQKGDSVHKEEAIRFVRALAANGGTEMAPALDLALDGKKNHERIRQVIFLTDGSVGNEVALFHLIESRLGDSRLFTVGIGSAPNSFFMSRAATIGRGSFTYIGKTSEVQQKMSLLFNKLEHPAMTNISLQAKDGKELVYYPSPIPDLYQGEPLLVSVKAESGITDLQVSGKVLGKKWLQDIDVQKSAKRPGVASLWARKKIRHIMDSRAKGVSEQEVRDRVLDTALSYHLLSKYTSLVAVEQMVTRPPATDLKKAQVAPHLPAGWQQTSKVYAGSAKTATSAPLQMVLGLLLLLLALWLRQVACRSGACQ